MEVIVFIIFLSLLILICSKKCWVKSLVLVILIFPIMVIASLVKRTK